MDLKWTWDGPEIDLIWTWNKPEMDLKSTIFPLWCRSTKRRLYSRPRFSLTRSMQRKERRGAETFLDTVIFSNFRREKLGTISFNFDICSPSLKRFISKSANRYIWKLHLCSTNTSTKFPFLIWSTLKLWIEHFARKFLKETVRTNKEECWKMMTG